MLYGKHRQKGIFQTSSVDWVLQHISTPITVNLLCTKMERPSGVFQRSETRWRWELWIYKNFSVNMVCLWYHQHINDNNLATSEKKKKSKIWSRVITSKCSFCAE